MQNKKTHLLKKLVIVNIPEDADIHDYEKIKIRDKKGIKYTYRRRKKIEDLDETTNFITSWNVFKSHLS